jgi:DNA modification methylase
MTAKTLTEITVRYWNMSRLVPYERNPCQNNHAVERMASAIRDYGFKIPILARSDGEIIDGHLRLKAAHSLGLEQVPVIVCDDWSPAQVKAFRILVNQSGNWADWDENLLTLELLDLKDAGFDLQSTGFSIPELNHFLYGSDDSALDICPELPAHPVSRLGDLWICDGHRVLCGDATHLEHTARLLTEVIPPLMVTDPPYGTRYDPMWRERAGLGKLQQTGKVSGDDHWDWSEAYCHFRGDVAYVWHAGIHSVEVAQSLWEAQFEIRAQIIWAKQHFALSRGHYHWQHEPCWYAVRRGSPARWCGDRRQSTLWQIANLNPFGGDGSEPKTGHGTQKPVELMRRPLVNHLAVGEVVYDPFLGSGTTLIAAEITDRICYGLELDPRYVDVIVQRWQHLPGKEARLDGDGRTFNEVKKVRVQNA